MTKTISVNDSKDACWIETYTNKRLNVFNLNIEDIDINDIAHSLSMQCRFNGHCNQFYSVAEHSVRCLDYFFAQTSIDNRARSDYQLFALLHDASEAYLGDIIRPIKHKLEFYKKIEEDVQNKIYEMHDQNYEYKLEEIRDEIKEADNVLLVTEARDLGLNKGGYWDMKEIPMSERIDPWTQNEAKQRFLDAYYNLTKEI